MSLFKFFSCCLPSRQSKRSPVSDLPIVAVSPKITPILDLPIVVLPPTPKIQDVFLLDMPDLVMREILKNLDFLSTQKLRKVNYSLRDYVDYLKVDSRVKNFMIEMTWDTVIGSARVHMKGYPSSEYIKSHYMDNEGDCEVRNRGRITIINGNFVDVFSEDFLIPMLKNQKSLLTTLKLGRREFVFEKGQEVHKTGLFEKVFDCLMKVLESRDCPLQVEELKVSVFRRDQLMRLLRHIDLKSLKCLDVNRLVESPNDLNVEIMLDLSLLECAENLKELRVMNFIISSPLRSIAHVPKLCVNILTAYCDDVLKFQETLLTTNSLSKSYIFYQHFPDNLRFENTLGPSEDANDFRSEHAVSERIMLSYYDFCLVYSINST